MKKILIVKADTNDADYVTEETVVTDEEIDEVNRIISALRNAGKANSWGRVDWGRGEMRDTLNDPNNLYKDILSSEEIEWFNEFVPYGEYGVHTIESIRLLEISNEEELL